MKSPETVITNITFHNEPKLSEHEVDRNFNERRLALVPLIRDFISANDRFKGREVGVTFAEKGVSSLIAIIETPAEKMVLKIPLSNGFAEGEAQFLGVWEQAGVKVPHVFEAGVLGERSYTLMGYVDAPVLADAYSHDERLEKNIYEEMGQTLHTMHAAPAKGYGRVIESKAEYSKFRDWIFSSDMQTRIKYVKENNLLNDDKHGSIDEAIKILVDFVGDDGKSSYCHDDFGGSNIFATHPMTVFDPNPRFNNGYIDLGRSLMNHISAGGLDEALPRLIKGYFGDTPHDKKVLHASVLLNCCMKLPYKHKTKSLGVIQNMQKYLAENKGLLQ